MKVSKQRFHQLAEESFAQVPRAFRKLLFNLEIDVRNLPGKEAGRWQGSRNLLGLYSGLHRQDMTSPLSGSYMPARIILYQKNIETECKDEAQLAGRIQTTLRHELAHHFGFSDEDLRKKWPEGA